MGAAVGILPELAPNGALAVEPGNPVKLAEVVRRREQLHKGERAVVKPYFEYHEEMRVRLGCRVPFR